MNNLTPLNPISTTFDMTSNGRIALLDTVSAPLYLLAKMLSSEIGWYD